MSVIKIIKLVAVYKLVSFLLIAFLGYNSQAEEATSTAQATDTEKTSTTTQ